MKKIITVMLAVLMLNSCIKKEQEQTSETKIVDLLNQNRADEALDKINEALKTDNSDEMLYLKASALSMKAGIDIYALFPLLKVKIFDVAIAQWSENRDFQKKAEAQKLNIGMDSGDLDQKKEDEEIVKKPYTPLDVKNLNYFYQIYGKHQYQGQECNLTIVASDEKDMYSKTALRSNYINIKVDYETCIKLEENNFDSGIDLRDIDSSIDALIRESFAYEHKKAWNERKVKVNEKNNYMKVLGTFWTLVDMVPMVTKIPKVSASGFQSLEEAQAILSKIRENHSDKTDEFGQKARKQLMMISALKIVAHIHNAFDLSLIKAPMDFLCKSNSGAAEELMASEKDAFYLLNTVEDQELIKKNKGLFTDLKTQYEDMVNRESDYPDLKVKRLDTLKASFEQLKKVNCED